ncbi:MAG: hypothetical protein ACE5KT_09665 [Methanosarcinales archaeon]
MRVVFPAPFGPNITKNSPFFISRLILFNTILFAKDLDKLVTDIISCASCKGGFNITLNYI